MTNAISALSNALNTTTAGGTQTTAQSDAAASQDRFLKLLVAQLNNQDPMNPMDNAQMTSQMAQINTVSGIQQLNETMKSMATQFSALQLLQGTAMIGHDVLTQGSALSIDGGKAKGAIDLTGNADAVRVDMLSPGGQIVGTLNLGSLGAGQHAFEWDASSYAGTGTVNFKVTATNAGKTVAATPLARDTVVSASGKGVDLKGLGAATYDAIQSIL